MQVTLDEATDAWGIKVERVEMWVSMSSFQTRVNIANTIRKCAHILLTTSLLSLRVAKSVMTKTLNKA
jgi:hypothetical protein